MEKIKEKSLLYINIALFIALIFLVIAVKQSFFCSFKKAAPGTAVQQVSAQAVTKAAIEPGYDISKIKSSGAPSREQPKNLNEIYANFPKEDVGESVPDAWTKVSAADKLKFTQGLDKQIAASRELLKSDPSNKKAKNLLAISEAMKKLAASGFAYAPSKNIQQRTDVAEQEKK